MSKKKGIHIAPVTNINVQSDTEAHTFYWCNKKKSFYFNLCEKYDAILQILPDDLLDE